jgi:hypothetical protein
VVPLRIGLEKTGRIYKGAKAKASPGRCQFVAAENRPAGAGVSLKTDTSGEFSLESGQILG